MNKQEVIDRIKSIQSEEELANLLVSLSDDALTEIASKTIAKWLLPLALMYAPAHVDADVAIKTANSKLAQTKSLSEKQQVQNAVIKYAKKYGVNPRVITRMLEKETSLHMGHKAYDANVVGDLDNTLGPSYGPGQIKVPTAQEIYKKYPEPDVKASSITADRLKNDIDFNIRTMCKLMSSYYKQFAKVKNDKQRWALAATAYNRGITKTKMTQSINKYGKSVAMKENQSLFKEYMQASEYVNYNDIYSKAEVPIKTQLQSLLANLPDEQQLAAFEGDIKTLKVSMDAMHFESPSMEASVNQISDDVLTIRTKLRDVTTKIQQLLRDMSLQKPDEKNLNNLEGGSVEGMAPYNAKMIREGKKWQGLSAKYDPAELVKKFGHETVNKGVRVEMEHTKDAKMALRIALDHLVEDPKYYDKLAKMEKKQ